MESSADGDKTEPATEEPAGETAADPATDSADAETPQPAGQAETEELAELRAAVEEKYDFEDFGPADMAEMTGEEWDAAFDAETWITGERLLDRVAADLKSKIAAREIFAVVERDDDQLLVYSDAGYAIVSADGTVEGEGGVRRDVEPVVAMCSMNDYEVTDPPEDYELPAAETVPEQTGEFGNLMIQLIAGMQLLGGIGLLGAWLLTDVNTLVAPVVGGLFIIVGVGLFTLVANARLSDRFRAEQYRNRLRAVEAGGIDRPELAGSAAADTAAQESPQGAEDRETEAQ
jgi:hypothetical protein